MNTKSVPSNLCTAIFDACTQTCLSLHFPLFTCPTLSSSIPISFFSIFPSLTHLFFFCFSPPCPTPPNLPSSLLPGCWYSGRPLWHSRVHQQHSSSGWGCTASSLFWTSSLAERPWHDLCRKYWEVWASAMFQGGCLDVWCWAGVGIIGYCCNNA